MTKRTTLAIILTLSIWLSTVVVLAATGLRPYAPTDAAPQVVLQSSAASPAIVACATTSCF